ncbi:MAG: LiaF domain-containing protein, partial [Actinomycetota bacterium]
VEVPLRGGIGERRYSPADFGEVRDEYRMLVGEMRLDLSNVDFPLGTTEIELSMAAGDLRVLLPRSVDVEVESDVHVGEVLVLGTHQDGLDLESTTADDVDGRHGRVVLHIEMGAGELQVARAAA